MATYTYEIQGRTVEFDQELDEEKLKEVEQYFIDLDAQTPTDEPVAPTPTQVNPDEITLKPTEYDNLFQKAGEKYNVDPNLLKSIAKVESDFNPNAENKKSGALGMMQIMPQTAKGIEKNYNIVVDPRDAESSVFGAAALMDELLTKYDNDVYKALEDYNGGPSLVGKSAETKKYSEDVMKYVMGKSPTNIPQTVSAKEQKAKPVPNVSTEPQPKSREIQYNEMFENEDFFSFIEDYMEARFGKKGLLQKDESRKDYIDRFANHMRHVNYNNIDLTQELMWTANADDDDKIKAGRAFEIWDSIPVFGGGYDKFGAFKDIGQALVTDITSYLGFGVGKIASLGASKTALRLATAKTKKLAKGRSTNKVDKMLDKVKRNTRLKAAGAGFLTEGTIGAYSGSLDQQLAVQQYRQEVVDPTAIALNAAITSTFGALSGLPASRITAEKDVKRFMELQEKNKMAPGESPDEKEIIELLGKSDEEISKMDFLDPKNGEKVIAGISTEQNELLQAQIKTKLMPMMVKVAGQIMLSDPVRYKRFRKGDTVFDPVSGKTLVATDDEKISQAVNRVLMDIGEIDEDVIQQATAKAGVDTKEFATTIQKSLVDKLKEYNITPKQFSEAMQSTVSDAGKVMGSYSYVAKLLGKFRKVDSELDEMITKMNGDIDSPGMMSYLGRIINRGERESKVLVTSALSTTTRNVMGNLSAMTYQSAAGVFESIFHSMFRAGNALLKGDTQVFDTNRGFVEQIKDSFTVWGKMLNYGVTSQTADKLLQFNRNISDNLFHSLQVGEKGTEDISKFSRFFSSVNLAQDVFFRKAMFTASVEQRMKDVGLNMYDYIAKEKAIPVDILRKASDDAMKGTFSYQFKDKGLGKGVESTSETLAHHFVRTFENVPFGSLAITFPRFMANALAYQYRYSPLGATSGMQDIAKGLKLANKKNATAAEKAEAAALYRKGKKALGEGSVGTAAIYAAYEYRKQNQDKETFMVEGSEGTEFNMQPIFPLAPYLAVGDYLAKLFHGESPEKIKESLEAIAGLKLPGGTASTLIDTIVSESSGKSAERVERVIGNVIGDFMGRFIQPGKPLFEFFEGMNSEPTVKRDPTAIDIDVLIGEKEGPVWLENMQNRVLNKIPENLTFGLFGKEDLKEAVSFYRDAPPTGVGSFFTNFTGLTMTPQRTEIEKEFIRLQINPYRFFPPSGVRMYDRAVIAASVEPLQRYMKERMSRSDYEGLSLSMKKQALEETMKDVTAEGRAIAKEVMFKDDASTNPQMQYRLFERMKFHNLPKQAQKIINQEYAKDHDGKTIEDTKIYEDFHKYYNKAMQLR